MNDNHHSLPRRLIELRMEHADLDSLIGRLPSRCRSLLQLRFRLGYEAPEIAERLGYRTSSIGKITTRCLAALSRELFASGLSETPEPVGAPVRH